MWDHIFLLWVKVLHASAIGFTLVRCVGVGGPVAVEEALRCDFCFMEFSCSRRQAWYLWSWRDSSSWSLDAFVKGFTVYKPENTLIKYISIPQNS